MSTMRLAGLLLLLLLSDSFGVCSAALIDGIHLDDEGCSGLVHDNATGQQIYCQQFFQGLQNLSETMANVSASLPNRLRLSVDAGTGWVCPQPSCTPPYCGCINITYQGVSRSVADHVIHFVDETVLMDYDRSPQEVYARALPYLTTADRSYGAKQIRVGVAISDCIAKTTQAAPSPPCQAEFWATRNESELAALMAAAAPLLHRHPSFAGFSVFGNWVVQSAANPALADTKWPNGTGTWYINHSMILDTNPSARNAWLSWAKTRRVGEVYIAPHHGHDALVSIPVRRIFLVTPLPLLTPHAVR